MTKEIVPKDAYYAIEDYLHRYSKELLLQSKVECDSGESAWATKYKPLENISLMSLARALTIGYDIEPAPEEKILRYYTEAVSDAISGDYDRKYTGESAKEAIEFVLTELDVKIDGINK